jgi:probable HAF family extracellular repeat protein
MDRRSLTATDALRFSVKHTCPLVLVAGLSMSLTGCFQDNPFEPGERARTGGFSASVAGTALGTPGGNTSTAYDINTSGRIVGAGQTSSGGTHAFYWQAGTMIDLGTLGPSEDYSRAQGISDAGHIVGYFLPDGDYLRQAFIWQNGTMSALPSLDEDQRTCTYSSANAVNSSGQVVGNSFNGDCELMPVLWQNGVLRRLAFLGEYGSAEDINDDGQVVGVSGDEPHAVLWQNGTIQDLGTLGGSYSGARGINRGGQVVGYSETAAGRVHAFLWVNGAMTDLGTLGGSSSYAYGINDNGQVVGYSTTASGQDHAFVWQNGTMTDLGTLGGNRSVAYAINNSGQVVGESNSTVGGSLYAVRWTAPAVPSAWTARAPLTSPRLGLAVAAANGRLYAIGGANSAGTVLRTVQAYSPSTNSWTTRAPLPAARGTGNGAVAINGIIYLAGGYDAAGALTRTLYAYNTNTNTWSTKASMPIFSSCGGSAAYAGKLYVYTACTRSSTGAQVATARLHRYDPSTNAWTSLQSAPASHFQPVVGVISGKLYVVGGNLAGTGTSTGRLDRYNPATNTWSTRSTMLTPRVAAAGAAIAGKLHVIGGQNGATYLRTVEAYDPVSDSWTTRSTMPTARAALGVGGLGGFLYAVGGRNSTSLVARNERYSP